jgi:hypothetical protein
MSNHSALFFALNIFCIFYSVQAIRTETVNFTQSLNEKYFSYTKEENQKENYEVGIYKIHEDLPNLSVRKNFVGKFRRNLVFKIFLKSQGF